MPASDEYRYRSTPGMPEFIKESRGRTLRNSSCAALTTDHRGHAVESGRTWLFPITTIGRSATIGDEPVDRHPREFFGCPRGRRRWPVCQFSLAKFCRRVTTWLFSFSLFLYDLAGLTNGRNVGIGSGSRGRQSATRLEFGDTADHFCRR